MFSLSTIQLLILVSGVTLNCGEEELDEKPTCIHDEVQF